jgi:hypothetical protein
MVTVTPKFAAKSRLLRYIGEDDRLSGNRPAVTAFEPDPLLPGVDANDQHLSVNSLEVETVDEIAAYHRLNWQANKGKVALSEHQVHHYTDAGRKCSAVIDYNQTDGVWEFVEKSQRFHAYRHRPVRPNKKNALGSASHCGVEFIRVLNSYHATRFAALLAKKGRFHLR